MCELPDTDWSSEFERVKTRLEYKGIDTAALVHDFEQSGVVTNEEEVKNYFRILFQRERKIPVVDVLIQKGFSSIFAVESMHYQLWSKNVSFGPNFFSEFDEVMEGSPFHIVIRIDKGTDPREQEVGRFCDQVKFWIEHRGRRVVVWCESIESVPREMVTSLKSIFVTQEEGK